MGTKRSHSKASCHNQRYRNNERLLQRAILRLIPLHRGRLTAKQITKATKLSRQTLYKHYPKLEMVSYVIEQDILSEFIRDYKNQVTALDKIIPDYNKRLFYSAMLFMAQRKEVFYSVCNSVDSHTIVHKMIEIMYPEIQIIWYPKNLPKPQIGSEKANIFITLCVEILCQWGSSTHCDIDKSHRYINRLLALSSEAYIRCK